MSKNNAMKKKQMFELDSKKIENKDFDIDVVEGEDFWKDLHNIQADRLKNGWERDVIIKIGEKQDNFVTLIKRHIIWKRVKA